MRTWYLSLSQLFSVLFLLLINPAVLLSQTPTPIKSPSAPSFTPPALPNGYCNASQPASTPTPSASPTAASQLPRTYTQADVVKKLLCGQLRFDDYLSPSENVAEVVDEVLLTSAPDTGLGPNATLLIGSEQIVANQDASGSLTVYEVFADGSALAYKQNQFSARMSDELFNLKSSKGNQSELGAWPRPEQCGVPFFNSITKCRMMYSCATMNGSVIGWVLQKSCPANPTTTTSQPSSNTGANGHVARPVNQHNNQTGNSVDINRDQQGRPTGVIPGTRPTPPTYQNGVPSPALTAYAGKQINFNYSNNKLQAIQSAQYATQFSYTGNQLTGITPGIPTGGTAGYPGGSKLIAWDASGRLGTATFNADSTTNARAISYTGYYGNTWAPQTRIEADGTTTTISYARVTDPVNGYVIREENSGDVYERAYYPSYSSTGEPLLAWVRINGLMEFRAEYDSRGRTTRLEEPGSVVVFYYASGNTTRNPDRITDNGVVTNYTYTLVGGVSLPQDVTTNGNTIRYAYNTEGYLVSMTNPALSRVLNVQRDTRNNVTQVLYNNVPFQTYEWLTTQTGERRLSAEAGFFGFRTVYTYDSRGNLDTVTGPDGYVVDYNADPNGRLLEIIEANGPSQRFCYDSYGRQSGTAFAGVGVSLPGTGCDAGSAMLGFDKLEQMLKAGGDRSETAQAVSQGCQMPRSEGFTGPDADGNWSKKNADGSETSGKCGCPGSSTKNGDNVQPNQCKERCCGGSHENTAVGAPAAPEDF